MILFRKNRAGNRDAECLAGRFLQIFLFVFEPFILLKGFRRDALKQPELALKGPYSRSLGRHAQGCGPDAHPL